MPVPHPAQLAELADEYLPASQLVHDEVDSELADPAGQEMQLVAPLAAEYWPDPQEEKLTEPALEAARPLSHVK